MSKIGRYVGSCKHMGKFYLSLGPDRLLSRILFSSSLVLISKLRVR